MLIAIIIVAATIAAGFLTTYACITYYRKRDIKKVTFFKCPYCGRMSAVY